MSDTGPSPEVERIVEEHRQLRRRIQALRELVEMPAGTDTPPPDWPAELSRKVEELHESLLPHFREEEVVGLPDFLVQKSPQITEKAGRIREDHDRILTELESLVVDGWTVANTQGASAAEIRRRATAVLERILRHEESETDLIQKTLLLDLGSAD